MLPPKFLLLSFPFFSTDDADILGQDYKIRLLQRLCLIVGIGQGLGCLVLCFLWLWNNQILFLYSTAGCLQAIVAYFVSYRLARAGHYAWGSRLVVLSTSLSIVVQAALLGTNAPMVVAFIPVMVMAIILIRTWEALLVASLCISFSVGLNLLVNLVHWYTPPITLNLANGNLISILTIAFTAVVTLALLVTATRGLVGTLQLQNQQLQAAWAEREQSQAAIKELEGNYRQLFEGNPQPIWVYDAESLVFLAVNDAAVQHYGYSREEFLTMTIKDIRPDEDIAALLEQTSQSSTGLHTGDTWRHYKKDRSLIEVEISRHSLKFAGREAWAVLIHDVTERKQIEVARQKAQEAVRLSEERLQQIISLSNDMIWDWDLKTKRIWRSELLQTLLSYSPEEIEDSEEWWDERVHPEDWANLHDTTQRIIDSDKQFWQKEYRFQRGDGSYAYIFDRAYIIRDEQGKAQRVVGATSDISQRKEAEEALRQSEAQYRTLAQNFPNGSVALYDRDLRFSLAEGREELAKVGLSPEFYRGKTLWEAIKAPYSQKLEPFYRAALAGETKTFEFAFGSLLYQVYALPVKNEQGEVFAGMIMSQNITERKQAEEAVRQSEARYRAIIEDQTELVCRTDLEGSFTFVNGAYCRYFEKSREELIGQDFMSFVLPEDREIIEKHKAELGQDNANTVYEQRVIKPNGEIGWQQWTNRAIFGEQGHFVEFQLVGRDITDKKMMEQELLKVQKLESVGLLAGGIAHDFNNILTGVLGNISLAKLDLDEQTERHELLDEAELAALRAKNLTQQLLTFSKGGSPTRKAASLKNLLEESVSFVLRGSNVRCQFTIAADLWSVEIDEGQISQVISNIVINADQAMPQGGIITIEVSNIAATRRDRTLPLKDGNYVQIIIRDEGTGIPEKNLSRIFDPYFTTKQRGSGLGLATSFSIMTKHEGFITAQSQPGQGTAFILYLPASPGDKQMSRSASIENTRPRPEPGRVLIMDDEEIILKVLKRMLEKNSYSVDTAKDGRKAIELYRLALETGQPYKTVIMDLTIPGGMGGKEALKELLALDPKVKAIVASGYSNDPVMAQFQEYGFRAALTKPFKASELYQKLEEIAQLLD